MTDYAPLHEEEQANLNVELRRFGEAFDFIPDHVVITDSDGKILYANKGVERVTGYALSESIGKAPGELWGGHMPKKFYEHMWHTIKTRKKPFHAEVENRAKNGISYMQEIIIFPVLTEKNEVKFFIGIQPDMAVKGVFKDNILRYAKELDALSGYLSERKLAIPEFEGKEGVI